MFAITFRCFSELPHFTGVTLYLFWNEFIPRAFNCLNCLTYQLILHTLSQYIDYISSWFYQPTYQPTAKNLGVLYQKQAKRD